MIADRFLFTGLARDVARGELTIVGECTPEQLQMLQDDAPLQDTLVADAQEADQRRQEQRSRTLLASQRLSAPTCELISDTLSCARYANRP